MTGNEFVAWILSHLVVVNMFAVWFTFVAFAFKMPSGFQFILSLLGCLIIGRAQVTYKELPKLKYENCNHTSANTNENDKKKTLVFT